MMKRFALALALVGVLAVGLVAAGWEWLPLESVWVETIPPACTLNGPPQTSVYTSDTATFMVLTYHCVDPWPGWVLVRRYQLMQANPPTE